MNDRRRLTLALRDLRRALERGARPADPGHDTARTATLSVDDPAEMEALARWIEAFRRQTSRFAAVGGCGCCVIEIEIGATDDAIAALRGGAVALVVDRAG